MSRPLKWIGFDALQQWLTEKCKIDRVGPITLSTGSVSGDNNSAFAATTKAAIALIQHYDIRHFRMIEREVRYIVNRELVWGAAYDRSIRQCLVDFDRYSIDSKGMDWTDPSTEDFEWYLARYASALVHEAVHGRVESLRFAYTKANRMRVERLCVTEQRRFLARLPRDRYDFHKCLPAFDPVQWEIEWRQNMLRYGKNILQRIVQRRYRPTSPN